jgi:hypothetical protein
MILCAAGECLALCFDAAYPPASVPAGCTAVLGYMGGAALNVWAPQEWLPFAHLRQFPCWVCDTAADPVAQAQAASQAASDLGWGASPKYRRAIVADMETTVDMLWWEKFADQIVRDGRQPVCYGSLSTVVGNRAGIVWAADWDDVAALTGGKTVEAVQYRADVPYGNTLIDLSVVSAELLELGGEGPRRTT